MPPNTHISYEGTTCTNVVRVTSAGDARGDDGRVRPCLLSCADPPPPPPPQHGIRDMASDRPRASTFTCVHAANRSHAGARVRARPTSSVRAPASRAPRAVLRPHDLDLGRVYGEMRFRRRRLWHQLLRRRSDAHELRRGRRCGGDGVGDAARVALQVALQAIPSLAHAVHDALDVDVRLPAETDRLQAALTQRARRLREEADAQYARRFLPLEADCVLLYPNQRSRGHGFNCAPLSSAVSRTHHCKRPSSRPDVGAFSA